MYVMKDCLRSGVKGGNTHNWIQRTAQSRQRSREQPTHFDEVRRSLTIAWADGEASSQPCLSYCKLIQTQRTEQVYFCLSATFLQWGKKPCQQLGVPQPVFSASEPHPVLHYFDYCTPLRAGYWCTFRKDRESQEKWSLAQSRRNNKS